MLRGNRFGNRSGRRRGGRRGREAVDVFAEFERNMELLKKLVREAIGQVAVERTCTHCLPHTGVTLPFELP